jgi:plastocyanin/uncharacterized membrane protein YozB (DUF420 family)
MNGFLGTGATLAADVNITIQLLMGIALLIGVMLARWRRYRAHGICQASVILLNLVMIALIMFPPFRLEVVPELPGRVGKSYYFVATLHAALGGITELLGLYVVLRASTNLLPKVLRFNNYKLWMRSVLVLWWAVIILGVSTYYIWYIASVPETTAREVQTIPIRPKEAAVTIVNYEFQPKDLTLEVGRKVTRTNHGSRHGVTADDGSSAATLKHGEVNSFNFTKAGKFPYSCQFYGKPGGRDMAGTIAVVPAGQ